MIPGKKICTICQKKLTESSESDTASPSTEDQPQTSTTFLDSETDFQFLNKSLSIIGESLVKRQKEEEKVHKIKGALIEKIKVISQNISPEDSTSTEGYKNPDATEIITQLKEKFTACEKRSQKVQILAILPKN